MPPDLRSALNHAKLQYKAKAIKKYTDFSDQEGVMSFIPDPAADETWATGGQIQFCGPTAQGKDPEIVEAGDIREFDPDTGTIYVDVPGLNDNRDISSFHLRYKPFDFAAALDSAFVRLENHPDLLHWALEHACGRIEEKEMVPPPGQPSGEDRDPADALWKKPWAIIWGPPGTGKTQAVADDVARHAASGAGGKLLVVAPTNLAADEVAHRVCGILDGQGKLNTTRGCLVYRGGRGAGKRLSDEFPHCLRDEAFAREYDAKKRQIEDLLDQRDAARHRKAFAEASRINKQIQGIRATLPDETMYAVTRGAARVIILTTFRALGLVGQGPDPRLVDKVVIDESGMVSRATTAAMATLGRTVLLAGDPLQIGPIFSLPPGTWREIRTWLLSSGLSHLRGVKESLMKFTHIRFLSIQYRMHPDISRVVSEFAYDGSLRDSDRARGFAKDAPASKKLPQPRAACLVLDDIVPRPEDACAEKAATGIGSQRAWSAKLAVSLALAASESGSEALILSPYRAQVRLLRRKLGALSLGKKTRISVGTIHRHQGAERDVVILDAVKGALSWTQTEIAMLLNVAASRARKHLILIASNDERNTPVLGRLSSLLKTEAWPKSIPLYDDHGQQELVVSRPSQAGKLLRSSILGEAPCPPAGTLGEEIGRTVKCILLSQDQMRLTERDLGAGHYLVRGVAGSGKSLILANWAARLIQKNPKARILVTYFNKGMHNLLTRMVIDACGRRWISDALAGSIQIVHASRVQCIGQPFDTILVDEAQDLTAEQLTHLYSLCKVVKSDGNPLRNFILFHDDSQNIYGRKTIEEFKQEFAQAKSSSNSEFAESLSFAGRSFVLRETYRSTRAIIGFAVNMALDPKQLHSAAESGLLEFMKVPELAKEGLLVRPEDSPDGVYEVRFAERQGSAPIIVSCEQSAVFLALAREIKRLVEHEKVSPGHIMVIAITRPARIAVELQRLGVDAQAYGGTGRSKGTETDKLPATEPNHVRCTTIFSCKGHEAPIVFFADINEVLDIGRFIKGQGPTQLRRTQRCMLYVGLSRAMIRLYVFGSRSPLMDAAVEYAKRGEPIRMVS
ncbi:MAG: AAA family ATPase [Elusimicrobia bacterium]|nr:AAA family ATPase [Elusimicrobiota bacterium]